MASSTPGVIQTRGSKGNDPELTADTNPAKFQSAPNLTPNDDPGVSTFFTEVNGEIWDSQGRSSGKKKEKCPKDIRSDQTKTASKCPVVVIDFRQKPENINLNINQGHRIAYLPRPKDLFLNKNKSLIITIVSIIKKDMWILINEEDLNDEIKIGQIVKLANCRGKQLTESGFAPAFSPIQVLVMTKIKNKIPPTWKYNASIAVIETALPHEDIFRFMSHHFESRLIKIKQYLTNTHTGAFFVIIVKLLVNNEGTTAEEEQSYTRRSYEALIEKLEDTSSPPRQQLQRLYHIPNVRIEAHSPGPPFESISIELRPLQLVSLQQFMEDCKGDKISKLFAEAILIDREQFKGTANISTKDGDYVKVRDFLSGKDQPEHLLPYISKPTSSGSGHLTAAAHAIKIMTLTGIYETYLKDPRRTPSDFLNALNKHGGNELIGDMRNQQGFNAMHMAIKAQRIDFLKMILYKNQWNVLRQDVVTAVQGDPAETEHQQYLGYMPRRLAESLSLKSRGQEILEEYDYLESTYLSLPLLSQACLSGNPYLVGLLRHIQPNLLKEKDASGANCLFYACGSGDLRILESLDLPKEIGRKRSIIVQNDRNESCIHIATMFGCIDILKKLSHFTFNIKGKRDRDGFSALDYCAINGDVASMKHFLEVKFPMEPRLLVLAVKYRRDKTIKFLTDECKLTVNEGVDSDGRNAVHHAVINGDAPTLLHLVQLGGDINMTDKFGRNSFHLAADNNNVAVMQYLIDKATEHGNLKDLIDLQDAFLGKDLLYLVRGKDRGRRAWHWVKLKRLEIYAFKKAMTSGQVDVARYGSIIISGFGANPQPETRQSINDEQDQLLKPENRKPDMTPLHIASNKEHEEVVALLLENGANPNIKDCFGATPVHYAAMRGNLNIVKALEGKGCRLDVLSDEDKSPKEVAQINGHEAVVNYIDGNVIMNQAKNFLETAIEGVREKLSNSTLKESREQGIDIRRHLITTLRDLTVDVNTFLFDLGSGPVMEESH